MSRSVDREPGQTFGGRYYSPARHQHDTRLQVGAVVSDEPSFVEKAWRSWFRKHLLEQVERAHQAQEARSPKPPPERMKFLPSFGEHWRTWSVLVVDVTSTSTWLRTLRPMSEARPERRTAREFPWARHNRTAPGN